MGHTLCYKLGSFLICALLCTGYADDAVLTIEPNWSRFFIGEVVTFICNINEGADTDWEYKIKKDGQEFIPYNTHKDYKLKFTSADQSGKYQCSGRRKSSHDTESSNTVSVTVSADKPRATLTAGTTIIPVGGSVTLSCSVGRSAEWKYEWFRRTQRTTEVQIRRDDQPNRVIRVSQGGIYRCRGRRGDPLFYSDISDDVSIEITFSNKVAVKQQQHNWTQIFSGETITLTCEVQEGGEPTEWEYEWRGPRQTTQWTHNNYLTFRVSESSSGDYMCKSRRRDDSYSSTEWSEAFTLSVTSRPKAQLRADVTDIPVGGSVTLTCSVNPSSSSGWKYYWERFDKSYKPLTTQDAVFLSNGQIRVSQEGLYRCRGGRGDPVYYTEDSQSVRIDTIVSNKAVVTLHPNWTEIYRGEMITVRCEIHGGDTEWDYEWETNSSTKPPNQNEYRIRSASSSNSGNYRCKGRMKSSQHKTTEWSDSVTLTVSDKPRPVLTVSPSWLSPGASVTLNCEVEHPSAGWSFYWYKAVPDLSAKSYSYELLPDGSGTAQDSYIIDGQTHTAGYVCRAGRGDPKYHTDRSKSKFVWSADFHSAASLTVSPDRVQHFTSDSVSLTCEGNSSEWRVKKFTEDSRLNSDCWTMTGSTCNISYMLKSHTAVYWCESGSGKFSNAVNITVQDADVILVSPTHPVTEGDPVTLVCKLQRQSIRSLVFFYKNDKLIQNDSRGELSMSAVSKSDEGFYKCQHSGKESPQSWMPVKSSRPENSFLVPLIVGLVCGIFLIIVLLLFCCFKQAKDSYFISRSKRPNQSSAADCGISPEEAQHSHYASILQGETSHYESVSYQDGTENAESGDVTYSLIELKNNNKRGKPTLPEESCVYSDVKIGSSTDDSMYAQVSHNKAKAKRNKGKSTPMK